MELSSYHANSSSVSQEILHILSAEFLYQGNDKFCHQGFTAVLKCDINLASLWSKQNMLTI